MSSADASKSNNAAPEAVKPTNFLRQIIESDLEKGTHSQRRWGGTPGDAQHHKQGQPDPADQQRATQAHSGFQAS